MGGEDSTKNKIIGKCSNQLSVIMLILSCIALVVFLMLYFLIYNRPIDMKDMEIKELEKIYVDEYNVKVKVEEDKRVHVEEQINVDFKGKKQELFRSIYLQNMTMYGIDEKVYKDKIKIYNLSVNGSNGVNYEGDRKKIDFRLNDPFNLKDGKDSYTVKYDIEFPKNYKNYEGKLFMELLPLSWPSNVGKYSIEIKMPKSFDKSKLQLRSQKIGDKDYKNLNYKLEDNTILYESQDPKVFKQGIALNADLEKDYFEVEKRQINVVIFYTLAIVALLINIITIITILLRRREAKEREKIEEETSCENHEFLKEDLCILEVARILKSYIDKEASRTFVAELIKHGYIDIKECDGKYFVVKLKETGEFYPFNGEKFEGSTREMAYAACFKKYEVGQEIPLKKILKRINRQSSNIYNILNRKTYLQDKKKQNYKKFSKMYLVLIISFALFIMLFITTGEIFASGSFMNLLPVMLWLNVINTFIYDEKYLTIFLGGVLIAVSIIIFFEAGLLIGAIIFLLGIVNIYIVMTYQYLNEKDKIMKNRIKAYKKYIMSMDVQSAEMAVEYCNNFYYDNMIYARYFEAEDNYEQAFKNIKGIAPSWYRENLI